MTLLFSLPEIDLWTVLLSLNLVAVLLMGAGQYWLSAIDQKDFGEEFIMTKFPFVSIHIPICGEPSKMILNTLSACLKIDYPRYEVIVLSNNTPDMSSWMPVALFCKENGIKFQNIEKLEGYKAGALDQCRTLCDPRSTFLFTVDADYIVSPLCLKAAVKYANSGGYSLIQFPQNYRNSSTLNLGLTAEFDHFFSVYACGSNRADAAIPTGTLSLISIDALDQVNGWKTKSITEDADLGIRLQKAGFTTRFVHENLGMGIMPLDIDSLFKQRARWIFGNIQSLLGFFRQKSDMKAANKLLMALQLTAWVNLLGIPILSLIILSTGGLLDHKGINEAALQLVAANFAGYFVFKFLVFLNATKFAFKSALFAFATHLSFTFLGAFHWWSALWGHEQKFLITCKTTTNKRSSSLPFLTFVLLLTCSIFLLLSKNLYFGFLFMALSAPFMAAGLVLQAQFLPVNILKKT